MAWKHEPGTIAFDRFWVVWNPDGINPQHRHPVECHARAEAERLARANPGQTFYVLETTGRVQAEAVPVEWAAPSSF